MEHSLIREVDQKTVDAYLNVRVFPGLFFEQFFPFKVTPFLTYETLIGANQMPVAADVVAYDVSAPEKKREIIDKLRGDIPAIKVMRTMNEKEINDYNIMRAMVNMTSDAGKRARQNEILNLVYSDIDFVVSGVRARLEWIALTALSTGQVSLSRTNNAAGLVTESVIDFQMPSTNKRKIASATSTRVWNNGTAGNYKPITDIEDLVSAAEDLGYTIRYLLMNKTKWQQFRAATEVIQYIGNANTLVNKPLLSDINARLGQDGLPEIVLVNSRVRIESSSHSVTTVNPWTTKYVVGIPELQLGSTMVGPLADETNPPKQAIISKSGPVLVEKYSEVNPVKEHTIGMINAFPSWENINACFRLDTEATPEADGLDD